MDTIVERDSCVFCRIANGRREQYETQLLHQDDGLVVFRDYKPATRQHLLVTTRRHIANVNSLTPDDLPLLKTMMNVGLQVLRFELNKNQTTPLSSDDVLLGFHRPPFNSVSHLHLHVIYPKTSMSFFSKLVFKPNTWWFQTAESLEASFLVDQSLTTTTTTTTTTATTTSIKTVEEE